MLKRFFYIIICILIFAVIVFGGRGFVDFINMVEAKSFDLRQSMIINSKESNKDIVIIAIDDASYEYILETYGEWPLKRSVYADLINNLEKKGVKSIVFDLMFVKSLKGDTNSDKLLINAVNKNKNVFVAMNFDNQDEDLRETMPLPDRLKVNVKNNSDIDYKSYLAFKNCRFILSELINGSANIGHINVVREADGTLRKMLPLAVYQEGFYPQLSLLAGMNYLGINDKKFEIDNSRNLIVGDRKIPLAKDGGAILNWYGKSGQTFKHIPFYKFLKNDISSIDFKDKVVYIGTTAVSLYDTKTVPVDKLYPGVEIHATFLNNFIDNNFIKQVPTLVNVFVSIIFAMLTVFASLKYKSVRTNVLFVLAIAFLYADITYLLMKYFNIWIDLIWVLLSILSAFIVAYITKYLLKSKDYEYQYKMATVDGLTGLYNHRFFQEQMDLNLENAVRYNNKFSLILIDIDFFKKFNDTYGHQVGDMVLKQVANTLKKTVRSADIVCRYGGEEMSIILPNTIKKEAFITAEKIRAAVEENKLILKNGQEVCVTISLGVATFSSKNLNTKEDIIAKADSGLYKAKENGRNQVCEA